MSALWTAAEMQSATLGEMPRAFDATGLSIDTRTLRPGDIFVALRGDARDGHEFVARALEAKASGALVSRRPEGAAGAPLLTVANTLRGLEDLARAARARSRAKIVAVTGSAGKTTTKEMLRLAFGALGRTHASAASYNNHWGVPLSLASMPRDAEYGVFETGMNHFGELRALAAFVRPHVALVTTIAPAHLEFFGSCEAIADAKSEIFEGVLPGGAALVPSDSPHAGRLVARARQAGVSRIMSFGARGEARLIARHDTGDGMKIDAEICGVTTSFRIAAAGAHIANNALGALLAVAATDGDVLNAAAALHAFTPLKGRGARFTLALAGGSAELVDESYNANPASMAAALAVLGAAAARRRIAVLGDMLEMGPEGAAHHAALARDVEAARVDLVFASGPQMRALWEALPAARRGAWGETSAAIAPEVAAALAPGDVVLVKGSNGMRMNVIVDALKARAGG
ncbi:MAG TPA: UDP-N-acetylmuramoylalanyl-D-glutamyl-2,6-diaminopimelate--D-alanyl-D-alanine ligase [Rhizomicrobium sp.]|nr:UDP-N-acetylmuramoylalanyl-D-glutamyl-2,6-diaminopimelate--D-alanyl-D-alanine ligase [Rhizomicrobium sp.]